MQHYTAATHVVHSIVCTLYDVFCMLMVSESVVHVALQLYCYIQKILLRFTHVHTYVFTATVQPLYCSIYILVDCVA
jgi:hypothetical protein